MTGYADAELAARAVLARASAKTRWCVVKEGAYGALLASRDAAGAFTAKALKVGQPMLFQSPVSASTSVWHAVSHNQNSTSAAGDPQACYCPLQQLTEPPLPTHIVQVEVKDTVGCGDSFAAAIVLGYISQHSIPSTLVLANAVGAATAMGRGAGTNVASASLVSDYVRNHAGEFAAGASTYLRLLIYD